MTTTPGASVPVRITDTVLRDANESLLSARLRLGDMIPIAEKLDLAGFHSLEVWGGATFEACMRFLGEDPWERLRVLKRYIKKTPLQMPLRGQCILGNRPHADDTVERFVAKARENGIDIFRIYDALNDVRNLEAPMRAARDEGAHVQAGICYTVSAVHSFAGFVDLAKQLSQIGADSLCVKDLPGLLSPTEAAELVLQLKAAVSLPIHLHTHASGGSASLTYLKAIEAGVDGVDTAISSLARDGSQPSVEALFTALSGHPRQPNLDADMLSDIARYFSELRPRYAEFEASLAGVEIDGNARQIPLGTIAHLSTELRRQGRSARLAEVLAEVLRVREDFGYPALVMPLSQMIGSQAIFNVVTGERYQQVPIENQAYLKGLYGQPPGPVDEQVRRKAIKDQPVVTCRPADLLEPELVKAKEAIGSLATNEEDVLSFSMFPSLTVEYLEKRALTGSLPKDLIAVVAAAVAVDSLERTPQQTAALVAAALAIHKDTY